jgi:diaminopimelate decarboxylase
MIEPGRAIVGNAGCTLYKVGSVKETYGGKKYIFVNGGMTDNPRTALYDAVYEAAIANRMNADDKEKVTVAGKCCESGDILIHDIELVNAQEGDLLCVASTGAYNYTMASNYNRIPKPAVVMVKDGRAKLVVKRETYDDIIRNDLSY